MTIEQERRAAPRFSIRVPAESKNSVQGNGFTKNVSSTGVLFEHASELIQIDTELLMRFSFFHGAFDIPFRGAVVRYTEGGFAARFVHLEAAQIEVLRRALSVSPSL
jgi:hypothetical protein